MLEDEMSGFAIPETRVLAVASHVSLKHAVMFSVADLMAGRLSMGKSCNQMSPASWSEAMMQPCRQHHGNIRHAVTRL